MVYRSAQRCLALGYFVAAIASIGARAQVAQVSLFYSLYYNQSGSEPDATPSGFFTTPLFAVTDEADLDAVRLTIPGSEGDIDLTKQSTSFYLTDSASSEEQMLASFPAGEYTFRGQGGILGSVVYTLIRPESALWPYEIPSFSPATYHAAQQIDPNSEFVFEFNAWDSDPLANYRYGALYIYDYDSEEPFFYSAWLGNGDTQHYVPAGTLPQGRHLVAQLYFASQINETVDSVYSVISFERATAMQIYTSGGTPVCVGDLNGDGFVDDSDFVDFVLAYNLLDCADPGMPMNCPADFNFDGIVDDADFVSFVFAYNQLVCP